MLHKDYDRKDSKAKKKKISGRQPQGAKPQVEQISRKVPLTQFLKG
jgi:hypothetical protein